MIFTDILILYGGNSPERAVSVRSALAVIGALWESPHRVTAVDYRGEPFSDMLLTMLKRADAVFLALHGGEEEGGVLQARLEEAGIFHYTGTAPAGAALALDKARAKTTVAAAGIPVAAGSVWYPPDAAAAHTSLPSCEFPAILKPLCGGSSVGLKRVESAAALAGFVPAEPMLLEAYLSGPEYSVGVLNGRALPAVELRPHGGMYDYAHKYTAGATEELCPAPIGEEKADLLAKMALRAFHVLGLRDFARIDFKENAAGVPCFLEANTLPGLTETSLLPLAAQTAGIPFPALCLMMAKAATARRQ